MIYYWEFRNGQWRRLETAPFPGLENVRPPGGLTDEALPDFLLQQGYLYTITVPGIVSTLNTAQAYEAVGTRDDLDYRFIVGGIAHAEAVDYIFLPQSPDWIQFLRLMHTMLRVVGNWHPQGTNPHQAKAHAHVGVPPAMEARPVRHAPRRRGRKGSAAKNRASEPSPPPTLRGAGEKQ